MEQSVISDLQFNSRYVDFRVANNIRHCLTCFDSSTSTYFLVTFSVIKIKRSNRLS